LLTLAQPKRLQRDRVALNQRHSWIVGV
jgi:hypothetical protein